MERSYSLVFSGVIKMDKQKNVTFIKGISSDPAPLGLLGFGMTTVLLNLHNAGIIEMSVMILSMGFAMGGLAQIIAGILEYKAGNTFTATAFTAYGHFWWSLVLILILPGFIGFEVSGAGMGAYLMLWCIFTAAMFTGALKKNKDTCLLFGSLTLLFLLLAIHHFTGEHTVGMIAGFEGIFCGSIALYMSFKDIIRTS